MMKKQSEVIAVLGTQPSIVAADEIARRVNFLVDYARSLPGCGGYILGISGGQDSSLAGRLAQLAVEQLRAEGLPATFIAVRLPYLLQDDEDDAQLALQFIQPDQTVTVNIAESVDALVDQIAETMGEPVTDFTKGNLKARARMMAQYTIAGDRALLVIGTDHGAEAVTGFFTKFGDGAADVLPLSGLTKNQGAQMLRFLEAPARLWEKQPTADLLDNAPGQSDESSLGVSYQDIDAYLQGQPVSGASATELERRYDLTEHKRRLPVTPNDTWWK